MFMAFWFSLPAQGQQSHAMDVGVSIKPVFGEKDLVLNQPYVNQYGDTLQVERFRFYLSGFELVYQDGSVYSEPGSYHLVDAGEDSTLHIDLKKVPEGKIVSIRFCIGVDSLKSVSGAFGGDLDPMHGMYWAWNSGYIYAKLEGKSKACPTRQNLFEFHIGGFSGKQNALRKVDLSLEASTGYHRNFMLLADAREWFNGVKLAQTNSIVVPGETAMQMADRYAGMFKLIPAGEK